MGQPTQAHVEEAFQWQHGTGGPRFQEPHGEPLGYNVGLQPYIHSRLVAMYERLKSCVAWDDSFSNECCAPVQPAGLPGPGNKRSISNPLCEAGSAKRACRPFPASGFGDVSTIELPEPNPSLPPPHVQPLAHVPLPSSPIGLWASPDAGHATGRLEAAPAGCGLGCATGILVSKPSLSPPAPGGPVHAPMPPVPSEPSLAFICQPSSPVGGCGVAPLFKGAKGRRVPPPSLLPRQVPPPLPVSPQAPSLYMSVPLSPGQGVVIAPFCGAATGLPPQPRQPRQPPPPPPPPLRPQPSHDLDAGANATPIDNTISDILDSWHMDSEARTAMWSLFQHSPIGKAEAFHLVVALVCKHCAGVAGHCLTCAF